MGKNKLFRFDEMKTLKRVFQPTFDINSPDSELKGSWNKIVFQNQNPIVLEVGCGKGEYTVNLAKHYPEKNFIGVDIKGARMWRGAKTINEENISTGAFLRIRMELIEKFFASNEISEIWITFPDPHPRESKENRRLISPAFIERYKKFLAPNATIHLKTDNFQLYEYALSVAKNYEFKILQNTSDLYGAPNNKLDLTIQTTYEKMFLAKGMKICYLNFVI
jgi:tRNA (guanine-N7-)-methyltransferase